MKIVMMSPDEIHPYESNPRLNQFAVDACAASIREFGFRQPIVVDEQMIIVVGHTRHKAALELGLNEVPVHVAVGLTSAQVKAYRIADNKTGELAKWDWMLLGEEIAELVGLGVEDLSILGFDEAQLESIMSGVPAGFIEDLANSQYAAGGAETSADSFSMTFVFPNEVSDAFGQFIANYGGKNDGKAELTQRIIAMVQSEYIVENEEGSLPEELEDEDA